jgi:hypothetical protein
MSQLGGIAAQNAACTNFHVNSMLTKVSYEVFTLKVNSCQPFDNIVKYKYFLTELTGLWLQRNSLLELSSIARISNPPDDEILVICLGSRLCNVWV